MEGYSHLSEDERDQIGLLRAAGRSIGTIARHLGRAKTTISRELKRNALPSGGYSPLHAAGAYILRRRRDAVLETRRFKPLLSTAWPKAGRPSRLRVGAEAALSAVCG